MLLRLKPCSGKPWKNWKALGASSILVLPIEKNDDVTGADHADRSVGKSEWNSVVRR